MRRRLSAAVAVLSVLAAASPPAATTARRRRATEAKTIEVTSRTATVTPDGERVDVDVGQPVDLVITADAAGEIHVHSSPEQELEFDAGDQRPRRAAVRPARRRRRRARTSPSSDRSSSSSRCK